MNTYVNEKYFAILSEGYVSSSVENKSVKNKLNSISKSVYKSLEISQSNFILSCNIYVLLFLEGEGFICMHGIPFI